MDEKLRILRLKKAELFSQIQMLSTVSDSLFCQFGKVTAEIMTIERLQLQENKRICDED